MTRYFSLALVIAVAFQWASCSEGDVSSNSVLTLQRDSLKMQISSMQSQLLQIESQLAQLDTTISRNVPVVTTKALSLGSFEHFFQVHGVVKTNQEALINSEIPGKVIRVNVKTGDKVNKGDVLFEQDAEVMVRNRAEIQSALELATTMLNKQEELWKQDIGSEVQYLQAKNQKESLDLKLASLNSQISKTSVKAPFSGIIDEVFIREGEVSNGMMPAVRLVNLDKVYLESDVSEIYISKIRPGVPVQVKLTGVDYNDQVSISRIGSYVDPNNRTFRIEVDLENPDHMLKPNLLAELRILDYTNDSCISIPSEVILQNSEGQNFVFVVEGNDFQKTAWKRNIESGMSYQNLSEVVSGLTVQDVLVVSGGRSIRDGDEIKILD